MGQSKQDKIQRLLRELTEWQHASGLPPIGSSDVASTGEATAAIEDLKYKLDQLGARYHWSESASEYQLDTGELSNPSTDMGRPQ
jgi:hypothetical protein